MQENPAEVCNGCGRPPRRTKEGTFIPLRQCSRCGKAAYHDVTCQRRHYRKHKKVCRPHDATSQESSNYRIEERPLRGNCMLAARDVMRGQTIGSAEQLSPLVAPVLFENQRSLRCAVCFGPRTKVFDCQDDRYVVHVCQTCGNDTEIELRMRQEMEAVRATAQQIPRILSTAILVFRICLSLYRKKLAWDAIECMIAHVDDKPDAEIHQQAIVMTVSSLLRARGAAIELLRIRNILSRIKVNAFTITDEQGETVGIGLFRTAHYINHSCSPNVKQSFTIGVSRNLPALNLRAKESIKCGEEITISYIETGHRSLDERQAELHQSYHFKCQCSLCKRQGPN